MQENDEKKAVEIDPENKKLLDIFDDLLESNNVDQVREIQESSDALTLIAAATTQFHTNNPILYQSLYPMIWEAVSLGYLIGRRYRSDSICS